MKIGLFAINYGTCADPDTAVRVAQHAEAAGLLDVETTRGLVATLRRLADEHERPAELGRLELTVTPPGPVDRALAEQYAELGVDRLVLLPHTDTNRRHRHAPASLDRILSTIDTAADQLVTL